MKKLNLAVIRLDGQTQARVALDEAQVSEYAEAMREGDKFPPVVVFHDGSDYWLADGFHRYHATRQIGHASIEAEVKTGTAQEAQLFSFGANAKRGLSTTHEDNRSIIIRMLSHPLSKGWTNVEIARHVGVSKMTVGRVKASLEPKVTKVESKKTNQRGDKPETEVPQEPEDNRLNELADTINELHTENQRLKDAIAVGQWDASEIEKIDIQDTVDELREKIRVLEIENHALRDSRDMFQNRNAELMNLVKSLQAKLKKLA